MVERKLKRYVIATLGSETYYLKSLHFGKYSFVNQIEKCTKFINKSIANDMLGYYYKDTQCNDIEMVVIPVEITYELIEE